ncbi:thioesterase family protein [Gloeocapsa sp. PCC 73106]|uniref:acyl-CoA thioesterase n=1 Tax=Gloeocapsa sp. PCC 73106 TaxID=102232 RepID=UPI0002AC6C4F|nr:thioesterase family protein [Gloeocapsa sp. PCC 73106]ELR99147.1 putative thioesterase [Gloeocapsa sp. PCC 73106]
MTDHQLPPTGAIEANPSIKTTSENWFEYPIKVYPHHTDYAGVVWHGTYITWLEAARVECLLSNGIDFSELVSVGCDLPVVDLSIRYHHPLAMGNSAIVKTRMTEIEGVRIHWDYKIQSLDGQKTYISGRVTLVAIDRDKGKIMRQLPPVVKNALTKISH